MLEQSGLIKWCDVKRILAIFLAVLVLVTSVQVLRLEEVEAADYSNVVVDAYNYKNFSIPRINLSGENFDKVNEAIWNKYYTQYAEVLKDYPLSSLEYDWWINDSILFIYLSIGASDHMYGDVISVNLPDGSLASNKQIAEKANITEKAFKDDLKKAICSRCVKAWKTYVNVYSKAEVDGYNSTLMKYTSEENLNTSKAYIDKQGVLHALVKGNYYKSDPDRMFAYGFDLNLADYEYATGYDELLQVQAYPVNISREEADHIIIDKIQTILSYGTFEKKTEDMYHNDHYNADLTFEKIVTNSYYDSGKRFYLYKEYLHHTTGVPFSYYLVDTKTGEVIFLAQNLDGYKAVVDISKATVSGITSKAYTGSAVTQSNITVNYNGKTLTKDVDYTISYKNNVKEGTATIDIIGRGDYGGKITKTFKINHSHKYSAWTKLNATQHQRVCAYDKTHVEKANHTWDSGKVTKAATETATGVKTYTCTTCKATKTETIPKLTPTQQSKIWNRLSGTGRYDTMKVIVDEGFTKTGGTVVIATGTGFKDALAASGLAGIDKGPVVLTDGNNLSAQSKAVLQRLKPKKIYVAGGTFAVKDQVLTQIRAATGVTPQRLYGQSSSGTSAALANAGKGKWKDSTAIIATNKSFKDALSVAPIAYAKSYPILLADDGKSLSKDVLNALKNIGTRQVIIVGGTGAVTTNVESQLRKAGINIKTRLAGANGVATSKAIAEWGLKNGMTANKMGVATSQNYPDALAGAALCGYNRSVLVLADDNAQANATFPKAYKSTISRGYVFGGEFAVGKSTFAKLEESVK